MLTKRRDHHRDRAEGSAENVEFIHSRSPVIPW
jgi:hypothetical protein